MPDDWGKPPWARGCFLSQLTPTCPFRPVYDMCEVFRRADSCHAKGLGPCLDG